MSAQGCVQLEHRSIVKHFLTTNPKGMSFIFLLLVHLSICVEGFAIDVFRVLNKKRILRAISIILGEPIAGGSKSF